MAKNAVAGPGAELDFGMCAPPDLATFDRVARCVWMRTSKECHAKADEARQQAAETSSEAYKTSLAHIANVWDQSEVVATWQEGWYAEHPSVKPLVLADLNDGHGLPRGREADPLVAKP